jgi:FixJ family two-component response regulator
MRHGADLHAAIAILGSVTLETGMDVDPIVVVVDDDAPMRAALRRVFTAARFTVETYASGAEMLDKCDFGRHAVLLLDVMMPGMTGLELQRALRVRGVNLPVIFLTGSGDIPMAVEAMHDGALDFLEKPFDNAELVARVRRAFVRPALAHAANFDPDYARRKASLTPREREVMDEVITGKTNKVVARDLGASFRTIEIHRARVMSKMQANSLADLVRMSLESDPGE